MREVDTASSLPSSSVMIANTVETVDETKNKTAIARNLEPWFGICRDNYEYSTQALGIVPVLAKTAFYSSQEYVPTQMLFLRARFIELHIQFDTFHAPARLRDLVILDGFVV